MMEQNYNPRRMTKEDFLSQGIDFYREECYDEALVAYEQAIQLDSHYALAFYGKGLALSRLGNREALRYSWSRERREYERALLAYERAIQLNPGYFRSHKGKGDILCRLERYDEALASYEKAIRFNPHHILSYCAKGRVLFRLKRCEEAFTIFEQAIHLDPNNPSICDEQAYFLACDGFTDEALEVYDKLLSVKSDYVEAYVKKAEIYRIRLDDHISALDAYNRAISVDRKYVEAYQYKAALLFDRELYGLAIDVYDRMIQLVSNNPAMYFWRGTCLLEINRYEKALADFEQVIQLDAPKSDMLVFYNKGRALCGCSRYKEALVEFKNALPFYCHGMGSVMSSAYYRNKFSYNDQESHILSVDIYGEMRKLLSDLQNSQELLAELEDCYNQSEKEFNNLFAEDEVEEYDIESEFTLLEPWESGDDAPHRDRELELGNYLDYDDEDYID